MIVMQVDHFPGHEFTCHPYVDKLGYHPPVAYPEVWTDRLATLKRLLEEVRLLLGSKPVQIKCGYRTVTYNAHLREEGLQGERHATGVALHSQHTEGRAADISVFGVPTAVVYSAIIAAHERGQLLDLGGVGKYESLGFVHVDTYKDPSGHLRRWNG